MRSFLTFPVFASALLVLTASGVTRAADEWGAIKGRVVYGGEKPPDPKEFVPNKDDKKACLEKKEKLLSEDWAMDPKTKGMKWAIVWLIPGNASEDDDIIKPIPIHPDLKKRKLENVVIDQPCCLFEPYCIALQSGQSITVKNSMGISHNAKIEGNSDVGNPEKNVLIPGGGSVNFGPFKPQRTEIEMSCTIHTWMKGHIRVFSHPYYVVTNQAEGKYGEFEIKDAPAGKYRLVIWQPGVGWVTGDKGKDPSKFGMVIDIKKGETTDLGDFKVKEPK